MTFQLGHKDFRTKESLVKTSISLKEAYRTGKRERKSSMEGRNHTSETKLKMSESQMGNINRGVLEDHSGFRGDKATYRAKHMWVERWYGKPKICENCKKDGLTGHQIHWANKSGEYKREIDDWIRLCAKCHKDYDKK